MDSRDQTMRIVLVGKTGVGKSAAGNTIVRRRAFKSTTSAGSVTSECQKERVVFQCKQLEVVDTPGLYDTKDKEEAMREVAKCISYSAPGPHVFLVVLQLNRFTEEEQKTVKIIQKLFGKEAADYTLVLFTRGDDLEVDGVTAEQFISENPELHEFILQCHGRYHVFNNRDKNPSQVTDLLEKINTMVQKNGGSCYTNEMLKEAERAIEEEKKKIQRERDITLEEARALAEKNNEFIQALMKLHFDSTARDPFATASGFGSRIATGAATGALAGLVGGPVGVGLGMVLGATVGTLAGLVDVVREECVIQ